MQCRPQKIFYLKKFLLPKEQMQEHLESEHLTFIINFIEKHNSDLLKSGIIHLDTKAENLGFSRQISGFDSLQDMEKEMDDILLGEKIELYVCCLF